MLLVDWSEAFVTLSNPEVARGRETDWALAAHRAVASAALAMVDYGLSCSTEKAVALSGGCFMNGILTDLVASGLERKGLEVLLHRKTPPNDGCISIGQAVCA